MDIGLIILIIIASLVGNVLMQSKRQGNRGRSQSTNNSRPEWTIFPPQGPVANDFPPIGRKQRTLQPKPVMRNVSQQGMNIQKEEIQFKEYDAGQIDTLEGKRLDIGDTYEGRSTAPVSIESGRIESINIQDNAVKGKKLKSAYDKDSADAYDSSGLELNFNEENLIKSIIMAEVLSPPKCRR